MLTWLVYSKYANDYFELHILLLFKLETSYSG